MLLSTSLPTSVTSTELSSSTEALTSAAVGASFTALTVMVTVAGLLSSSPSVTLYVKLSEPL